MTENQYKNSIKFNLFQRSLLLNYIRRNIKMANQNRPEPTWTYLNEINRLKASINDLEKRLNKSLQGQEQLIFNVLSNIKAEVKSIMDNSVTESKEVCSSILSKLKDTERDLQLKMDSLDLETNQKHQIVYNSLDTYRKKLDRMQFDIINNDDNISITYTNPDGISEYGSINKVTADNKTLKMDNHNVISLKYSFDKDDFDITKDIIRVTGLTLNDGKYLDADRIKNDLSNASYNINSLNYKLERLLSKINNINGYTASNNFKKAIPEQDKLTRFVLDCISPSGESLTIDAIPVGTRVKNTYDNHIWVFNRYSKDGLNIYKWEDFGSDNICIASNDGVHGLVTGSQEHFKAFIDVNGTISINGLEEEFHDLLQSLSELNTQVKEIQSNYEAKLSNIEDRLKRLEENA